MSQISSPAQQPAPAPQRGKGALAWLRSRDWNSFSMNFLSVVLGIVITFSGDAWLKKRSEQQDVRDALRLVRDELRENMGILDGMQAHINDEDRAATYLMRYYGRFEECEHDSMVLYCNVPLSAYPINTSSEALELLKSSSLFQKIEDKDLALSIIAAYNVVEMQRTNYAVYYEKKEKLMDQAMLEEARALFAREQYSPAEMWAAITSTNEGKQFLNEIHISAVMGFNHDECNAYLNNIIADIDRFIE